MIRINLDENFKPFGGSLPYKHFSFPSGFEQHIKLAIPDGATREELRNEQFLITTRIKSSDDIMLLLLATDALKRMGAKRINVFIPFLPYARQDRLMVAGEPFSLKVMANLINSQGYENVYIFDAHSEITGALINNCVLVDNHKFVRETIKTNIGGFDYLIAPDAGAYKKIYKLAEFLGYTDEIIVCNKARNLSTGSILTYDINFGGSLADKHVVIVDDICDGGATFIALAKKLNTLGVKVIHLVVSHGIFSKKVDPIIVGGISCIHTTNSIRENYDHPYLKTIQLTENILIKLNND